MSKPLLPLTIQAPGFLGLNLQQSGSILPPGWATKLDNFIYDDVGRIACRKGSQRRNATVVTNTPTVKALHEYIDASGNIAYIFAADNKIWKDVSGTMTDVSGTITTPTADNWQFVNFNGWCLGFQVGHAPIVSTSATSPAFADSGGTQYNGSMGLSAFGRAWTVLDNVLYYSDLLINNFTAGSSGNFDLSKYWPNGMDEAVALQEFNDFLVVFGKESIIVYENADDVTNMVVADAISGIGCLYRDSVQRVGSEIVFMSSTGLRTLKRTLLAGGMPLSDISQHVRDDLLTNLASETAVEVKSVYHSTDGFYLLSLPTTGISYMFDLKFPNQDGTWKVSKWTIAPTAMMFTQSLELLMAVEDGYVSKYVNYNDNLTSAGTGGSTYDIDFEGVWNDFGESSDESHAIGNMIKIPKTVSVLGSGTAGGDVIFKWALDYSTTFKQRTMEFSQTGPARYGIAKYSIDSYGSGGDFERVRSQLAGTGQVIKVGVFTTIDETAFALQRIDVLAKLGRIGI